MSFASPDFRAVMSRFATGVTIVTTALDQAHFGLTVNAFCSVSLNPPLVLVSLDHASQTYAVLRQSGVFAINILTHEQQPLALRFARKDLKSKTFDDIPLRIGETGVPLFSNALAWIECRVAYEYPGGDHILILGEVANLEYCADEVAHEPLLYYRSLFQTMQRDVVLSNPPFILRNVTSSHKEERRVKDTAAEPLNKEFLYPLSLFAFES